jgi:hypothetical protein
MLTDYLLGIYLLTSDITADVILPGGSDPKSDPSVGDKPIPSFVGVISVTRNLSCNNKMISEANRLTADIVYNTIH